MSSPTSTRRTPSGREPKVLFGAVGVIVLASFLVVQREQELKASPARAAQAFVDAVNRQDWKSLYAQFSASEVKTCNLSSEAFERMCAVLLEGVNWEPVSLDSEVRQPPTALHRSWKTKGGRANSVTLNKTPEGWKPYSGQTILWLNYMVSPGGGKGIPKFERAMREAGLQEVIVFPNQKIDFASMQGMKDGTRSDPYLPWSPTDG